METYPCALPTCVLRTFLASQIVYNMQSKFSSWTRCTLLRTPAALLLESPCKTQDALKALSCSASLSYWFLTLHSSRGFTLSVLLLSQNWCYGKLFQCMQPWGSPLVSEFLNTLVYKYTPTLLRVSVSYFCLPFQCIYFYKEKNDPLRHKDCVLGRFKSVFFT